jgi:hypothetical protein
LPARARTRTLSRVRVPGLGEIDAALRDVGMASRGAFHPAAADGVPLLADGSVARTLVLAGQVGASHWAAFARDRRNEPDPLDRWSARALGAVAARYDARVLLPGDGPPFAPVQRGAPRAEPVHPSPLGLLIHPDHGLWHAYRGALAFAASIEIPPRDARPSPCESCADRPCLGACPVAAFAGGALDAAACVTHLESAAATACFDAGCLARAACPVGTAHRYPAEVARFHLHGFVAIQRGAKE